MEIEDLTIASEPALHLRKWKSSGEPLLLLHGMGANTWWWERTAAQLAERFEVAALDFSGHGESDWLPSGHYTMDGFLNDIERARLHLGWRHMHIGAHSMGARVALNYCQNYMDHVKRLVAIDFRPEFTGSMHRKFASIARLKQPYYSTINEMLSRFRLEPPETLLNRAALEDLAGHCIRMIKGGYSWKFDWRCFAIPYGSAWPTLSSLQTEVLVVRGSQSNLMTEEIFKKIVRTLDRAQEAQIAHAYHHVPLDAPKELALKMIDFLTGKAAVK